MTSFFKMAASIGTWTFSLDALKLCSDMLLKGGTCLDAIETGISAVEKDKHLGRFIVGSGGYPNSSGYLQLDAAIMDGRGLQFGAVAALEGIHTPIQVARKVLEESTHNFLVGKGAQQFAVQHGFTVDADDNLLSDHGRQAYQEYLRDKSQTKAGHDTLGVISVDKNGNIAAGVSSSGVPFKQVGRVGDSPLPGSGLYADNQVGAAIATGDGDNILRFCPSFLTVELMRQGASPQTACQEAVRRMMEPDIFEVAVIAMNKKGEFGAAGTVASWDDFRDNKTWPGFPYTLWNEGMTSPEIRYVSSL